MVKYAPVPEGQIQNEVGPGIYPSAKPATISESIADAGEQAFAELSMKRDTLGEIWKSGEIGQMTAHEFNRRHLGTTTIGKVEMIIDGISTRA